MKFSSVVYAFFPVSFFYFLYKLAMSYPKIVNDTKITDWASAIFNGVVAFMAIIAFFVAKNWKSSLTEKEALGEGINLKVNVLPTLKGEFYGLISGLEFIQQIEFMRNKPDFDTEDACDFFQSLNSLHKELHSCSDRLRELNTSISMIYTYNWYVISDKNESLKLLYDIDNELYDYLYDGIKLINETLKINHAYFKLGTYFPNEKGISKEADVHCVINSLNQLVSDDDLYEKMWLKFNNINSRRSEVLDILNNISKPSDSIYNLIKPEGK